MNDPAFLLADSEAYEAGRVTGVCLFSVLSVLGAVKCIALMRRKMTSSLCVIALFLFCVSWFIAAMLQVFKSALGPIGAMLFGFCAVAAVLGGLVCGIVGLALYDKQRYNQGRAQAVWGIVLNGLFLVIGITSAVMSTVAQRRVGGEVAAPATGTPAEIEMRDKNFRLSYSAPWIRVQNPKALNPAACAILRRAKPEVFVGVIVEELDVDADALMEIARSNLESAALVLSSNPVSREEFGGIKFLHYEAVAEMTGQRIKLAYGYWVVSKGGFAYQIAAWGKADRRSEVMRHGREIVSTFRLLDPNRPSGSADAVIDATLEHDGFATRCSSSGWKKWTNAESDVPGRLFAAQRSGMMCFLVDGFPLGDRGADIEDAMRVLLTANGVTYSGTGVTTDPAKVPGAETAMRYTTERSVDGARLTYRGIVVLTKDRALLFQGWYDQRLGKQEGLLDEALATVMVAPSVRSMPAPSEKRKRREADLLHELGLLSAARHDWPRAASVFGQAYGQSQHNPLTLESWVYCVESAGDIQGAKKVLDERRECVDRNVNLLVLRGRLKDKSGDGEGAAGDFARAFEDGARDESDLNYYLGVLVRLGRAVDAIEAVERYLAKGGSANVRRWRAELYGNAGKPRRSMELYEEILTSGPFDPLAAYGLGEQANQAEEHAKAESIAGRLIAEGHDNVQTRMIEGWSHFGRKNWRRAKQSFEKALGHTPDDPDVRIALARASAMLGEGDNSAVKKRLEPVALPESIVAEFRRAEQANPATMGAAACYLLRAMVYHFETGKPFAQTVYRRVRILDQAGVEGFGTLDFPFDPLVEDLFVNRLAVIDEKGEVVCEGTAEEQFVVDQSALSGEGTHRKFLRVIVPGLRPGCVVEYTITRRDRVGSDEFPFQTCICASETPAVAEAVVLTGEVAAVRAVASPRMTEHAVVKEEKNLRSWFVSNPSPWRMEPYLPPLDSYLPVLFLGSARAGWAGVAKDYLKEIDDLLKRQPAVEALAREIAGPAGNEMEKVSLLTRHVQKNVSYQAVEFGRRARIPKPPGQVLASRFGDCKDQALLLHGLLEAVGVESHLALVNTGVGMRPELPSLDQFDHMIVHVPALKVRFVDPTQRNLPGGALPPELFHRSALVLDPRKPRVEAMPDRKEFPPNRINLDRQVKIEASGDAEVQETCRAGGYYGVWLRNSLLGVEPAKRLAYLQTLFPESKWQLLELDVDALDDPSAELVLKTRYRFEGGTPGAVVVPALWEASYLSPPFLKERQNPAQFEHPVVVESRAHVALPKALAAGALDSWSGHADSDLCRWKLAATQADGAMTMDFRFEGVARSLPAARYAEWNTAWTAAVRALQQPIKLVP